MLLDVLSSPTFYFSCLFASFLVGCLTAEGLLQQFTNRRRALRFIDIIAHCVSTVAVIAIIGPVYLFSSQWGLTKGESNLWWTEISTISEDYRTVNDYCRPIAFGENRNAASTECKRALDTVWQFDRPADLMGRFLTPYGGPTTSPWPLEDSLTPVLERVDAGIRKYNEQLQTLKKDKSDTEEYLKYYAPFLTFRIALVAALGFGIGLVRRIYDFALEKPGEKPLEETGSGTGEPQSRDRVA